jgi:hypothetical protein
MRPEVGKKSRSGNQENRKPRREKTEEGRRAVSAKVGRKSTRKKTEFQFAAFPPRSIRPPHPFPGEQNPVSVWQVAPVVRVRNTAAVVATEIVVAPDQTTVLTRFPVVHIRLIICWNRHRFGALLGDFSSWTPRV